MRKLTSIVCLCVLTLALLSAISGQRRGQRGGVRPGQNQPATTSTPTPATVPSAAARPATEQASSGTQTLRPAVEYQSFMQLRFYENQGGFLIEDLELVSARTSSQYAMRDTYWIRKNQSGYQSNV